MNLFKVIFLDTVLLTFPILIYLIYLSTNKDMTEECKKTYLSLAFITSLFLIYNYCIDDYKIISLLVLNSIIIFSYLEDLYVFSNIFIIVIGLIYNQFFYNISFLLIGYIIINILYILNKIKKINTIVFVEISIFVNSIIYTLWIYLYNYKYFDLQSIISILVSYVFIINIVFFMYQTGKNILKAHMDYKELKKEKQIRLSLFKITHEIKNPIAVCKGYLDMLNMDDTKQVKRYVPIIKSEVDRLLSLLQDFLLINKENLDLDIMDFNLLIEDTLDKLKPLLDDNKIVLNLDIVDEEVYINGDYNRLSQVLINIIKNSIEALEEKESRSITIDTKIVGNKYSLIVEDNGIGMDKETLNKMKNPFFTTKKRGSGLGVSLIYEIIEAHDGKVKYKSEYGKGTKVIVELPICE